MGRVGEDTDVSLVRLDLQRAHVDYGSGQRQAAVLAGLVLKSKEFVLAMECE